MDKVLPDLSLHVTQQSFKKRSRPNGTLSGFQLPSSNLSDSQHTAPLHECPRVRSPRSATYFSWVCFFAEVIPLSPSLDPCLNLKSHSIIQTPILLLSAEAQRLEFSTQIFSPLILISPEAVDARAKGSGPPPLVGMGNFCFLNPLPPRGPLVTPPPPGGGRGSGL